MYLLYKDCAKYKRKYLFSNIRSVFLKIIFYLSWIYYSYPIFCQFYFVRIFCTFSYVSYFHLIYILIFQTAQDIKTISFKNKATPRCVLYFLKIFYGSVTSNFQKQFPTFVIYSLFRENIWSDVKVFILQLHSFINFRRYLSCIAAKWNAYYFPFL